MGSVTRCVVAHNPELDADWKLVRAASAPAQPAYRHSHVDFWGNSQATFASLSVRAYSSREFAEFFCLTRSTLK